MSIVWVLGFLIGAVFGLRRTSVILFAPIAAFIAGTIVTGGHPTPGQVVAALSFPQFGYLTGLVAVVGGCWLLRQVLRVRGRLQLSGSLRTVRTAIAQDLHVEWEPPQEMPGRLARLAAQMQSA